MKAELNRREVVGYFILEIHYGIVSNLEDCPRDSNQEF